ncbi:HAD family hydrolase [Providencia alcalifaciens]|uniref:HAD family hydrolase n=1 Tax=Providencia alcalifaciens TaxID=126385 RepID=UPI00029C4D2C|nr:haloacid dehalogenase-like hydrolase [Providencia alcalifaciens]EKT63114.1 hypothetical protein OO9_16821 [Providencia alcalifaciens Dmel2]
MMNKKIAVFDICDTIYPFNTTYSYIKKIFHKKSFWPQEYILIKILNKISKIITGVDFIRNYNINLLKGMTEDQLEFYALNFIHDLKENQLISNLMTDFKKNNYEIVLLSATLAPIAKYVAKNFSIEKYYSTSLEYNQQGQFTGKISKDLLGNKYDILKEISYFSDDVIFITDNKSDSTCIPLCNKFIAVIPSGKNKNVRFWREKKVSDILCL